MIDNLDKELTFRCFVILFLKTFVPTAILVVSYFGILISKVVNMNNNNLGMPGNQKYKIRSYLILINIYK